VFYTLNSIWPAQNPALTVFKLRFWGSCLTWISSNKVEVVPTVLWCYQLGNRKAIQPVKSPPLTVYLFDNLEKKQVKCKGCWQLQSSQ